MDSVWFSLYYLGMATLTEIKKTSTKESMAAKATGLATHGSGAGEARTVVSKVNEPTPENIPPNKVSVKVLTKIQ